MPAASRGSGSSARKDIRLPVGAVGMASGIAGHGGRDRQRKALPQNEPINPALRSRPVRTVSPRWHSKGNATWRTITIPPSRRPSHSCNAFNPTKSGIEAAVIEVVRLQRVAGSNDSTNRLFALDDIEDSEIRLVTSGNFRHTSRSGQTRTRRGARPGTCRRGRGWGSKPRGRTHRRDRHRRSSSLVGIDKHHGDPFTRTRQDRRHRSGGSGSHRRIPMRCVFRADYGHARFN